MTRGRHRGYNGFRRAGEPVDAPSTLAHRGSPLGPGRRTVWTFVRLRCTHDCESMIGSPHRVFVADDHALFREGVKALLAEESDLAVAGEAGTAKETLQRIRNEAWDVLLLDISLPDGSGIDLLAADSSAQAGSSDPDPVDASGGAVRREPVAGRGERLHHEGCGSRARREGDPHAAQRTQVHQHCRRADPRRGRRRRQPARRTNS